MILFPYILRVICLQCHTKSSSVSITAFVAWVSVLKKKFVSNAPTCGNVSRSYKLITIQFSALFLYIISIGTDSHCIKFARYNNI